MEYNDIFKNKRHYEENVSVEEENQLIEYKENIFTKIKRIIFKVFSRKSN